MMHQRISKKILIYLFYFFTLVTITNTNLSKDFYKIKKMNIGGLDTIETKEIYEELKIFKDDNIFLFNKDEISEKIYENKIVQGFQIFKNYPSTLNIEITKTKFLAVTKKNNKDYFIGANGKLIETNNNVLNLPYIFGNIKVQNFLNFKKTIDDSNFKFDEIENLYYFKSNRWDILTKDGLTLKMPSNLTKEKLNLFLKIIRKENFNSNKIIDFRQSDMMVINE